MKIGFIGAGHMAQAIITGLLAVKAVAPSDIVLHGGHKANYEPYAKQTGTTAVATNVAVAQAADIIILAMAPFQAQAVIQEIKPALGTKPLVSMLSGISLTQLADFADTPDQPLVRIMPNLNVAVGQGMTAIAANTAGSDAAATVTALFEKIGSTIDLPEKDFLTFGALAGSSPAFVYMFIDAMARAGVKHGLSKKAADQIAAQAVIGSGAMVMQNTTTASPLDLADQVASPGGTTVVGMLTMEEAGFATAVVKGIDATIAKDSPAD